MNSPATNDIIAGTCAGLVSVIVCHPLDTIRVRLQTAPKGQFLSVTDVVKQTFRNEGVSAFYKGIYSPLTAQALMKATMFFSFGTAKRFMIERNAKAAMGAGVGASAGASSIPQQLPLTQLFLCGSFAGVCNSFVSNPFELIRNRLQVQYAKNVSEREYKGMVDVVVKTVRTNGVRSLWLGVFPMMLRDAPGVGAWYCTYEGVRRLLVPPGEDPRLTPKWKILLSGASAGVMFWVAGFPQDTIKNVIQTRKNAAAVQGGVVPQLGFFATGADLVRREGLPRLFKGFSIAALRGIPGASTTFLTYQLAINELQKNK